MTTNYWNYSEGKSVPSGGANQINTAGSQGSNLGNWLQKYLNYPDKTATVGTFKLIVIGLIIAAFIYFIVKKRRR